MHWLSELICHRTQPSGAWEVNKVVFWNIALQSCTWRETEFRQTPPSSSFGRNASFILSNSLKKIISLIYSLVSMQRPKSQTHCKVANTKEERHPNQQSAVSGNPRKQGWALDREGVKGKWVPLDHGHIHLSWPPSPGSTQKKGCQVSVTGLRVSAFAFSIARRNLYWNLTGKYFFSALFPLELLSE